MRSLREQLATHCTSAASRPNVNIVGDATLDTAAVRPCAREHTLRVPNKSTDTLHIATYMEVSLAAEAIYISCSTLAPVRASIAHPSNCPAHPILRIYHRQRRSQSGRGTSHLGTLQ